MLKKIIFLMSFVFLIAANAFAMEFSADTTMTTKEGTSKGKIYFKKDKSRMELDTKLQEGMIMITRMDKKVAWNIMPKKKMYMEIPLTMKNKPMVEEKMEGELERKQVGSETIDGHPTKKYLITYKSGNNKEQVYQWWATDINFPVKTASIGGDWVQEYKNIKIGPQSDSLFELPSGYQKFQMPGGMNLGGK